MVVLHTWHLCSRLHTDMCVRRCTLHHSYSEDHTRLSKVINDVYWLTQYVRGINNIQGKNQNVGHKKQLQRQIQRYKMPKMSREYRNTGTCHRNMSQNYDQNYEYTKRNTNMIFFVQMPSKPKVEVDTHTDESFAQRRHSINTI